MGVIEARAARPVDDDKLVLKLADATVWTLVDKGLAQLPAEWQMEIVLDGVDAELSPVSEEVRGRELREPEDVDIGALELVRAPRHSFPDFPSRNPAILPQ